ncbi:Lipopolysaccharide biosynthesis protein WzxC [termite gut metagenome]|uniref:Lipopolysaccharide biosynthesis protein WzxC n=1 Tax=termite gut metagenome TaxID=433724 RepID=A0A5J4QZU1_9ZZZZ
MGKQSLKEKTAKGLFWGGLSNGVQQLLGLVFGIFLARILNADDYGMVGMLTLFSLIASTIQESGFTAALANKKAISHEDYNAVFWCSVLVSLSLYIILFFCAPLIAGFYDTPELTTLARYSFLGFFISASGIAHHAYLFRNLMVKQKAITMMISLTLSGIVGITLALLGMSYWGIATQNLVYIISVSSCYWFFSPWRPTFQLNFKPLKGMLGFSSKLLVSNICVHVNHNLFSVLLGKFYSEKEVGYFTQANKWNSMGHSLITGMLQGVTQPVLTQVEDSDRQRHIFRKMLRFTAFVSFPAMFGLSLIARELIRITITDKWLPAVDMMQLLCIGGAFSSIVRLYSDLMVSKGKSGIYMWITIGNCLVQLPAMLFLYPYGVQNMITAYVIINICWLFVWHYYLQREIKLPLLTALKDILPFVGIASFVIIVTYFITANIENLYLLIIGKIIIAGILYIAILWICRATTLKESIAFLFKRKPDVY